MGIRRKRKLYKSDADECRERGFKVGDLLAGDEGYGVSVIQITAIGEKGILAKQISFGGEPELTPYESSWTLSCRDWEIAE
jgi:hypothetical protein